MYTKYGIKSYPDNKSYIDHRNNYNKISSKNYTLSGNDENILETIFTRKNDNLSFYQSNSKNSFMNPKKEKNQNNENITPIMKGKNTIYNIQRTIQERNKENIIQNFSYNYSDINTNNKTRNINRTIKNNINNINININPNTNNFNFEKENPNRINIDKNIIKTQKRKRIIKSCKKQYNVQKRDNFNVLSYKPPEEDDSDINYLNINKKNIIHLYKKQGVDEIFFPSKRTRSPNIPTKRKKMTLKYQTHTLNYQNQNQNQNFFGAFIIKKGQMVKSLSKKRIKEINDFNIDKLIEIGDKIMNSNILCLKNIKKNKYRIPINTNTNNNGFNFSKYSKRTFNNNNTEINLDENKENIPMQYRVIKKLITKNKIKKSKLSINNEENLNEKMPNDNAARIYLNFKKEKNNYNNNNIIDNNTTNPSVVIRRRNKNTNEAFLQKPFSFDKNIDMNDLGEEIPKRKFQKITGDLSIKANGSINNNYIILNKNRKILEINNDNKKKIITDENNISRNSRQKIEKNNRKILIDINVNKKFNKYRNIKLKQNKTKNYYGYDDRHNLEDTINNHSYYESLHSNKRGVNYNIYNKGV